jgi:hypothetical protein
MSKKNERPVTTSTAGFARVSLALILLELITVTSLAGKYFYIRSDDRPDAITHIITVLVQYEHERLEHCAGITLLEHCWNCWNTSGTPLEESSSVFNYSIP